RLWPPKERAEPDSRLGIGGCFFWGSRLRSTSMGSEKTRSLASVNAPPAKRFHGEILQRWRFGEARPTRGMSRRARTIRNLPTSPRADCDPFPLRLARLHTTQRRPF